MEPERTVHYADSGALQIAYQVIGDGPLDVVVGFDWASNIDLLRENPRTDWILRRFPEFGRMILFDMRSVGLSDPSDSLPSLEEWVDDVESVMDAVKSDSAALVGFGQAAQLGLLFAAMHPARTAALVTVNGFASLRHTPDHPHGFTPEAEKNAIALIRERWGSGEVLRFSSPGFRDGPGGAEWIARVERAVGSPRRVALKQQLAFDIDVTDVLPAITVPTLVIHSGQNRFVPVGHAEYLVEHIAGSQYLELPGADHAPSTSPATDVLMDGIEEFLTGSRKPPALDRALMTIAFTDIVGSTEMAVDLGDRRWRNLLGTHESVARQEIEGARGRVVKFTGDGVMATFDGPARAVQCMRSLGAQLKSLGLPIRAGVHTGEVELLGDDIGGIAVHIAARIAALAGVGEVLTSSTVRDLVAGSGLVFEERGEHSLKGVPEPWRIYAASP